MSIRIFNEMKAKVIQLIDNEFNLILFGENGCGKTHFIKELLQTGTIYHPLYLKMSNIIFIDEFYRFLEDTVRSYIITLANDNKENIELQKLKEMPIYFNKFTDIWEILQDFPKFDPIIVIDEIEDIGILYQYSKNFQKVLQLGNISPKVKFILIADFDIGKSELLQDFPLTNFISIPFAKREKDAIKQLTISQFDTSCYDSERVKDTLNTTVENYYYNFANFNEYLIGFGENLEFARYPRSEYDLENNFSQLNINCAGSKNKTNLFTQLKKQITKQIITGPLHINYLNNNTNIEAEKREEENEKHADSFKQNLTESLSRSQKVLLLAAFFASESSPKIDHVIFKNVKKTKISTRQTKSKSIKSKVSHAFNIHRLVGIYTSISGIIFQQNERDKQNNQMMSMELLSDINTLIDLNLLRYIKFNESSAQSKKMAVTIGIDFAEKIANDFQIKITDFIKLDL